MNDEIKRLKYLIQESLNDSEVNKDLLKELEIKENLMLQRDSEINGLMSEK